MRPLDYSRLALSVALPVVMFPAIFFLQLQLGFEVALFPFYMVPVAVVAWEHGGRAACVAVVAATFLWAWANKLNAPPYSSDWLHYYNGAARGAIFALTAYVMLGFRKMIAQHRQRMEAMRALLNVCHGCGSVQGSDGQWIPFEELERRSPTRQSCECPRCRAVTKNPAGA